MNAVVFIEVEVVIGICNQIVSPDIVIVFDDKWVAFFGGFGNYFVG